MAGDGVLPVGDPSAAGELCLALSFADPKVYAECGKYADEEGKEVKGGLGGEEGEGQPYGKADDRGEDSERDQYVGRTFAFVDQ